MLANGLRAVDAGMKALIEELKPGVHQFWPMRFTQPKGDDYPVAYFGMKIGRYLDSFLPAQSDASKTIDRGNQIYLAVDHSKKGYAGLVMSAAVIGSAHLWCETHLQTPELYFSDAMQEGIAARGLRIRKHFKLTVT